MQSYQNPKNVDQGWMASFLPYLSPGIPHAAASPWQATSRATKALSEAEKHKNHPAGFDESTPIDSSAMQLSSGTQWLDATPPTGRRLPRMPTPTPAPTPAPPLLSLEPAQAPPASSLKLPPQAAAALARQRNHTTTTPPRPPPTDRLVVPLDANPFSPLVYTPSSSGSSSRAITPQPGGAPTPQPVSTSKPVTSTTRRARQDGTRKKRARHSASRDYALAKDPNPRSEVKIGADGKPQGEFRVFGAGWNVRARFTEASRSGTALTRKIGTCGRCRGMKQRCSRLVSPYLPCGRCAALPPSISRAPCIPIDILDLHLHRYGSTLNNSLHTLLKRIDDDNDIWTARNGEFFGRAQTVTLTQGMGGVTLDVPVGLFHRHEGDVVDYHWSHEELGPQQYSMPPYYITDMNTALENIREYSNTACAVYIDTLMREANPILAKTFRRARQYAIKTKSKLIRNALQFWAATRLIERPWVICNDNPLDLKPCDQPDNPWPDQIPVTPVMDTQLDELAIAGVLKPLRSKILCELSRMVYSGDRKYWTEIYFTTIILLCNFENMIADLLDYAERHGLESRPTGKPSLSEGYIHACKTLLAFFHYACGGSSPFSIDWERDKDPIDVISPDLVDYIQDIKQEVAQQKEGLDTWKTSSMYRNPMYWCYQLYCRDWTPDVRPAGPLEYFTEEDLLVS